VGVGDEVNVELHGLVVVVEGLGIGDSKVPKIAFGAFQVGETWGASVISLTSEFRCDESEDGC
jgi:hypothetical protein